jgi:hypothetical protein
VAARCIAVNYVSPPTGDQFDASGNFLLYINALYIDTVDATKRFFNQPVVALPPASPGTWSATIKSALAQNGIDNGFSDLVTTQVFIPTYA